MPRRGSLPPAWFWLVMVICVAANRVASYSAAASIAVMSNVSEFAEAVRADGLPYVVPWQLAIYPLVTFSLVLYVWPILRWFDGGCVSPPPPLVRRRTLSSPVVFAAGGFAGWVLSVPYWIGLTVAHFGKWTPELASQHVLSPLVNGYLAATISYFLVDRVFRSAVYPKVFPDGRLAETSGTLTLGMSGRFVALLLALSFIPMFVMLGLVRAAEVRWERGLDARSLLAELGAASEATFALYVLVGAVLALIVTRTITRPLVETAAALRRIQGGDFDARVVVDSADEVGLLEDGVNDMAAALRDRERILATFGRVVEPAVRDVLLGGHMERGGRLRHATILFCDLRGFTSLSERRGAEEAVETLNEFFTVTTGWVRECGGFVDKFIGDALLVVFGLFGSDSGGAGVSAQSAGAAAAVRCASGIVERLEALSRRRVAAGKDPLAVTIAVHSGEVVAGVIGSADRHEYTVVGDTVNVASRLQQIAKDHGGIVISAATFELARTAGAEMAVARMDSVSLRGRSEPVTVHVLCGQAAQSA
ncbi:MAG: HAMP domain-containing protein [Deltaproteobacteria bacterium]|nr:HAMP domain-containing protein [Deltaproteobacteria bacterium]